MSEKKPAKRVLITGGSRGIGRALVYRFAKEGCRVAFTFVSKQEFAEETEQEARRLGAAEVAVYKTDVAQEADISAMAQDIGKRWDGLDILINNAGRNQDNLLMRLKSDEWDQIMNVNLRGAMLCTREFVRSMMKQRDGAVLFMSSVTGQSGNAGQAAYSASKAGMIGLTKSLAKELASRNIRVNAVAPGFIETEMTEVLDEKVKETLLENIPLGRIGKSEEVADLCWFLTSSAARYITGQVVGINGGLYV